MVYIKLNPRAKEERFAVCTSAYLYCASECLPALHVLRKKGKRGRILWHTVCYKGRFSSPHLSINLKTQQRLFICANAYMLHPQNFFLHLLTQQSRRGQRRDGERRVGDGDAAARREDAALDVAERVAHR